MLVFVWAVLLNQRLIKYYLGNDHKIIDKNLKAAIMDKNELNGRKVEHVIDINNRSLIKTDSSVQKEGSPAWFREQAAKTEHQYH